MNSIETIPGIKLLLQKKKMNKNMQIISIDVEFLEYENIHEKIVLIADPPQTPQHTNCKYSRLCITNAYYEWNGITVSI